MSRTEALRGWKIRAVEARYKASILARNLGLCSSHLRRLFHEQLGCSPRTALRELRLQHFKELVAAGKSLKEIGNTLGLKRQSYLSALFQRAFKMPLRTWRRALLIAAANADQAAKKGNTRAGNWTASATSPDADSTTVIICPETPPASSRLRAE